MDIKCFMVEFTGKHAPVVDGIAQAIYKRLDTGEEITGAPIGAMFYDEGCHTGPDGKSLVVVTPGGWWYIDSQASNCTKPDDKEHRCWVRHGEPPNVTVDKSGNTCAAGAGSIMIGSYHGFLRNGLLTDC